MFWGIVSLVIANGVHAATQVVLMKQVGARADRVSLGFGPTLWSRMRNRTLYRVALVPLGVIVRLRAPVPVNTSTDLASKPASARLAVFALPPLTLLLIAFCAAYLSAGEARMAPNRTMVGGVAWAAEDAGVFPGDEIVSIAGYAPETWSDVGRLVNETEAETIDFELRRDGGTLVVAVRPTRESPSKTRRLGVGPELIKVPAPEGLARVEAALKRLEGIVRWQAEYYAPKPSNDPVLLANGLSDYVMIAGLQNFELCLLSPFLDGSRLLFLIFEVVARRRLNPKYEKWFNVAILVLPIILVLTLLRGELWRAMLRH